KRPRQARGQYLRLGLGMPASALKRRAGSGAEPRELDEMHGARAPRRLDEVPLELHLPEIVVRDEERMGDALQGRPERLRPREIADDRLDPAPQGCGLLEAPHQGPHRDAALGELTNNSAADEPGGSRDEDHTAPALAAGSITPR